VRIRWRSGDGCGVAGASPRLWLLLLLVAVIEALEARGALLAPGHLPLGRPDNVSQGAHDQEEDDAENDEGVPAIEREAKSAGGARLVSE
jgi:hypothetical protein